VAALRSAAETNRDERHTYFRLGWLEARFLNGEWFLPRRRKDGSTPVDWVIYTQGRRIGIGNKTGQAIVDHSMEI
jgi:hypothetical protein